MNLSRKKNICVISSSRAEFGILRNFVKSLEKIKFFKVELILIGKHSIDSFGTTKSEIKENKIKNYSQIKLPNKNNNPFDISKISSILLEKLSNKFKKNFFDLLLILGDRYEILITAYAAVLHRIPITHLSGGDETRGSYDNQFRHAISKFSNLHFVTNENSKKRLIRMGEDPKKIFNYGSLSIENIKKAPKIKKNLLEKEFNFKFKDKNFLVTYHPETLTQEPEKKINILLKSIEHFKNYQFIFTSSNNDEGGNTINRIIKKFSKKNKNIKFVNSFGQLKYFSMLQHIDGVIGNSSSGVHEVPSFKIGTVNIGSRQDGRLKIKSVINTSYSHNEIIRAIKKISSKKFKNSLKNLKNPYYKVNTKKNIIKKIISFTNKKLLISKKFYG